MYKRDVSYVWYVVPYGTCAADGMRRSEAEGPRGAGQKASCGCRFASKSKKTSASPRAFAHFLVATPLATMLIIGLLQSKNQVWDFKIEQFAALELSRTQENFSLKKKKIKNSITLADARHRAGGGCCAMWGGSSGWWGRIG